MSAGIAWAAGEIPLVLVMVALLFQWRREDVKEARRYDRNAERDDDAQLREVQRDARNAQQGRSVGRSHQKACSPFASTAAPISHKTTAMITESLAISHFFGLCQWWIDAVGHQHVGHQWCDHRQARDDDEDRRRDDKRGGAELCFGQCEGPRQW